MGYFADDRIYRSWKVIVPDDTAAGNMPLGVNGIYVGGAGNISMQSTDAVTVTFTGVPAGTILPVGPLRINATGTTATLLLALT